MVISLDHLMNNFNLPFRNIKYEVIASAELNVKGGKNAVSTSKLDDLKGRAEYGMKHAKW